MARTSTLRKRALKRMASLPPARELRPSGIKLCDGQERDSDRPAPLASVEAIGQVRDVVSPEIPPVVHGEVLESRGQERQDASFESDDASFFETRETLHDPVHEFEDIPEDRHSQLDVVQRRSRASSIVRNVLVGCAAFVALGFGVQKVRAGQQLQREESLRASAAQALTVAAARVTAESEVKAAPIAPQVAVPTPVASPEVNAAAAPVAVAAAAAPSGVQTADAKPVEDKPVVDVKVEKRKAEQALDQGKYAVALLHAQAAVDGDAEDAGGWLLLGAVKQAKGDVKGALEAFTRCMKEGKRGPKHECAAMMR
jgi:hypothetical protein